MNHEQMSCSRVQGLLNGYIDGELDLLTSLDIEEHLNGCASCSKQRQALEKLHTAFSDRSLYHPAPAALEKRIRSSLKKTGAVTERRPALSGPWLVPAVALLAVLMFLAGLFGPGLLGRGLFAPNPDTSLAQQVQNAHIRSLMADHLMDVTSSDQHTVKPWFNGKLDFSPPVTDLAAQGFPLVGGRLDYLDGHPVAVLVYRRNKHIINLFIWPSSEKQPGPQPVQSTSPQNGYNLFHWNQSGMTFWTISDLNVEELMIFIRDFQAGTK